MKITPPSSKANLITASMPEFSPTRSRMPSVNSTTPKSLFSSTINFFLLKKRPARRGGYSPPNRLDHGCGRGIPAPTRAALYRLNENGRSVNSNRPFVWRKLFLLLLLGRRFIEIPLDQPCRVVDDDEAHQQLDVHKIQLLEALAKIHCDDRAYETENTFYDDMYDGNYIEHEGYHNVEND